MGRLRANPRKNIVNLLLGGLLLIGLSSCGEGKKEVKNVWQEQIQLQDGQVIWVERSVDFSRNAKTMGEGGNITKMEATITIPPNSIAPPPPVWRFNAVPMVLDYDKERKTWFIVASYYYCNSWVDAGKPPLGQWLYEVKDGQWIVVPFNTKHIGRTTNMYLKFTASKKLTKITTEDINKIVRHLPYDNSYQGVTGRQHKCR